MTIQTIDVPTYSWSQVEARLASLGVESGTVTEAPKAGETLTIQRPNLARLLGADWSVIRIVKLGRRFAVVTA